MYVLLSCRERLDIFVFIVDLMSHVEWIRILRRGQHVRMIQPQSKSVVHAESGYENIYYIFYKNIIVEKYDIHYI